jgi:hypothetical protein
METLKRILLLNAISSGITGIILALFSESISSLFGINAAFTISSVGIFLIVFAAYVIHTAIKGIGQTPVVIALDMLWVAGSVIILVAYGFQISMIGNVLIVGVALWVGLMAFLQRKFSRGVV